MLQGRQGLLVSTAWSTRLLLATSMLCLPMAFAGSITPPPHVHTATTTVPVQPTYPRNAPSAATAPVVIDAANEPTVFYPPLHETEQASPWLTANYNTGVGELSRKRVPLPIRYEADGVVLRIFPINRNDKVVRGDAINARLNLEPLHHGVYVPRLGQGRFSLFALFFHYDAMRTNTHFVRESIESNGQTLGVLSPRATLSGFAFNDGGTGSADIENLDYRDRYSERKLIAAVEFMQLHVNDTHIAARAGFFKGKNKEKHNLDFTTFNTAQTVTYRHKLDTDRTGVSMGANAWIVLNRFLSAHANVDARFVRNEADIDARLLLDGTVTENQRVFFNTHRHGRGYQGGIGLLLSVTDAIGINAGAALETWEIPIMRYPIDNTSSQPRPLNLRWQHRTSWMLSAGIQISS